MAYSLKRNLTNNNHQEKCRERGWRSKISTNKKEENQANNNQQEKFRKRQGKVGRGW